MPSPDSIRSVDRALSILLCFSATESELSLVDISKRIDIAPSTTTRLLGTLLAHGFIARNPDNKRYYLGPQVAHLGAICFANLDLRKVAVEHMTALRDKCGENVSLYVPQGRHRVCIERVDGTFSLRRVVNIGDFLPITKGAAGKLLLAFAPEALREGILETAPEISRSGLAKIREQGYAVTHAEREEDVSSIAAPVFNAKNEVSASLSVSGPTTRFADDILLEKIGLVRQAAHNISRSLGADTATLP